MVAKFLLVELNMPTINFNKKFDKYHTRKMFHPKLFWQNKQNLLINFNSACDRNWMSANKSNLTNGWLLSKVFELKMVLATDEKYRLVFLVAYSKKPFIQVIIYETLCFGWNGILNVRRNVFHQKFLKHLKHQILKNIIAFTSIQHSLWLLLAAALT